MFDKDLLLCILCKEGRYVKKRNASDIILFE